MIRKPWTVPVLIAALAVPAMADVFTPGTGPIAVALPDAPASTSNDLLVSVGPNVDDFITDINVIVDISHTFTGDLDLFLTHVDTGTVVQLYDQHGGGANDIGGAFGAPSTLFDDGAATPIAAGAAPYSGSFIPFASLSAFVGETVSGTWRLTSTDNLGADVGTLNGWSLVITNPEPGTYALFGLGLLGLGYVSRRRKLVQKG